MRKVLSASIALAGLAALSGGVHAATDTAAIEYTGTNDSVCELGADETVTLTITTTSLGGGSSTVTVPAGPVSISRFCNTNHTVALLGLTAGDLTVNHSVGGAPLGFGDSFELAVSSAQEGASGPSTAPVEVSASVGAIPAPLIAGAYSGTVTVEVTFS